MRLRLETPSFFSFDGVVRSHGWYDLPPFSYDAKAGALTTAVADEGAVARRVAFSGGRGRLVAEAEGLSRTALEALTRRVFSLDVDLSGFRGLVDGEPVLRRGLARGGGRMLRAPSLFEDAVKVLLTTNCSWEATRGMVRRLITLCGASGEAFPEPAAVARFSPRVLRERVRCGYRAGALSRLARRVASGRLDLARWEEPETPAGEVREAILAERGFGPYASEGLLRILGRHDYLALDSWVRKQYRRFYPGRSKALDAAIARRYARFGNFRGLALWLDVTREWREKGA